MWGWNLIPALLPNLTPAQQNALEQQLQADGAYELTLNTEAYRAMGVEATMESGIGRFYIPARRVYLSGCGDPALVIPTMMWICLGPVPTYNGIPVGPYSPLVGARPFRRPPHTGFFYGELFASCLTVLFNSAFASRADDSTFLGGRRHQRRKQSAAAKSQSRSRVREAGFGRQRSRCGTGWVSMGRLRI